VHVKDLVMPAGIKVVTHGRPNQTVATVVEPEPEVVAAPVVVEDKKKGKGKK
jgi:large subunit ribosomal protein L25